MSGITALSTAVNGHPCFDCTVSFFKFDAQRTNQEVDFFEGSQGIDIDGYFLNGSCPSDCGIVKIDQASGVVVRGSFGPMAASSGTQHSVMIDTNYAQDPTGFTDVPDVGVVVTANSTNPSSASDVFVTGCIANPTNVAVNVSGGTPVHLQCASGAIVNSSDATGPSNTMTSLTIEASSNVMINGGNYSYLFTNTVAVNGQTIENQNLTFKGTYFSDLNQTPPYFNTISSLSLQNVTFDLTKTVASGQNFFPAASSAVLRLHTCHCRVQQ
jgi:hypothetical protein